MPKNRRAATPAERYLAGLEEEAKQYRYRNRRPIPYRGQPQPKYPRRRKQFRNLRAESLQNIATVWTFGALSILVLVLGLVSSGDGAWQDWGAFVIVFALGMMLTLALADATRSVNKFRKGYDFDTSPREKPKKDDDDRSPSVSPDPW